MKYQPLQAAIEQEKYRILSNAVYESTPSGWVHIKSAERAAEIRAIAALAAEIRVELA